MQTRKWILALGVAACATGAAAAKADFDFGLFRDHQLDAHSDQLFGIVSPVEASSELSISAVEAESDARNLVTMAKHLHVRVVADLPNVPPNIDMMALWPNDQNPTHLIACNEQGPAEPGLVAHSYLRRVHRNDPDWGQCLRSGEAHCVGHDHLWRRRHDGVAARGDKPARDDRRDVQSHDGGADRR